MMKSQTIPIHAAFQERLSATVVVAMGPMTNPDSQFRSISTAMSTPCSLHQLGEQGRIRHQGFQSHDEGRPQTLDTQSD